MKKFLTTTTAAAALVLAAGGAQAEGKLSIYHWFEYIPQTLLDKFASENDVEVVMDTYDSNESMLATLKARGLNTAILSNGSKDMLEGAVDFSGVGEYLDAVLSVEDIGTFKPARAVYDMVGARMGCAPDEVLFVSSNGWDAAGAAGYGFQTVWVNRAGDPVDRLPHRPHHTLSDLSTIPELAR